jgi:hypothetical protein
MALKKRLVGGDVFYAHCSSAGRQLQYPVNQQKRVSVRYKALYINICQHVAIPFANVCRAAMAQGPAPELSPALQRQAQERVRVRLNGPALPTLASLPGRTPFYTDEHLNFP